MHERIERELDGREVTFYKAAGEDLPVVYSTEYEESGQAVLEGCARLGCPAFHLVTIANIEWDEQLSPWPAAPVVTKNDRFAGAGPAYLQWLLRRAVPAAEAALAIHNPRSYIAGYSMAGLFALWSLYETDFFQGAMCASGSLWYPGFADFAAAHALQAKPRGLYLSLGDKESRGRNPVLQQTAAIYQRLLAGYEAQGIPVIFESNPGNHYAEVPRRVAKGLAWLLGNHRASPVREQEAADGPAFA